MKPRTNAPGAASWSPSCALEAQGRDRDREQRAALIALLQTRPNGAHWHEIMDRVVDTGDALRLWFEYFPMGLFGNSDADGLLEQARHDIDRWEQGPFRLHTVLDGTYPRQIRSVRQMPPILFTHGVTRDDEIAVSIVGSRTASQWGLDFASEAARRLVGGGVTVVAGLAEGIDTAAHRAALDSNGRTVAVLGNGLDRQYPRSNRLLQHEISERGMLMSQFMPDFAPTKWSFPARNAVMSAYGQATVIVEATEHSGTRIQAREAVSHGRAVVMTERVAQSTKWGAQLVGKPGVEIASTPAEAIDVIEQVLDRNSRASELLMPVR